MTLRIYEEVLVYVRRMRPVADAIGRHDPDLARQLRRALASMVLNTAEGQQQRGGKGANRFDDAMGSTDESRACNQTGDALGYLVADPELIAEARRIAKVLFKLSRR
jgi:four helix bundle protein